MGDVQGNERSFAIHTFVVLYRWFNARLFCQAIAVADTKGVDMMLDEIGFTYTALECVTRLCGYAPCPACAQPPCSVSAVVGPRLESNPLRPVAALCHSSQAFVAGKLYSGTPRPAGASTVQCVMATPLFPWAECHARFQRD